MKIQSGDFFFWNNLKNKDWARSQNLQTFAGMKFLLYLFIYFIRSIIWWFLIMKNITIKDIAKRLSISPSTVSRALVNDKNIRKETKEKVLEAAQLMGYKRNPIALNLKSGKTNTIGVIVPEMITPFVSSVLKGIQKILSIKGIKVLIAQSDENSLIERENLSLMENHMVDGIIICPCHCSANKMEYQRIEERGTPIVFYDRYPKETDVSKVIINDYMKSHFLVEHLIRTGRRKIVHFRAPSYILNAYERFRGYKDCIEKYKLSFNEKLIVDVGMTIEDGEFAARKLLESRESFDAIFACTDTVAIGAMNFLRDQSIKVPEDVSVAGFSGTALSKIVYPSLTTVKQPLELMGETCANILLEKIKNPHVKNQTIVLDAEIIYGNSTKI